MIIDEIVIDTGCEKSGTEIETSESIEDLKFSQVYEDGGVIILNALKERNEWCTSRSNV